MTLPSVELRPGTNLDKAISVLQRLEVNCHGGAQPAGTFTPESKQMAYVKWATETEGELRTILTNHDAVVFFGGARHRDICSMTAGEQILPLIGIEISSVAGRLGLLANEFQLARTLFAGDAVCVVPDTSFYIEHAEKLEDVDFHALTGVAGPIKILVPIVVVDELDGLKRSGSSRVRWRAAYSLAVIDRLLVDPPRPGLLSESQHMPPRAEVTLQIVFNVPGHLPLPISDDEIVDRCASCQPYTSDLAVITYDTGQSTRARGAGLKVKKLSHDLGPDPDANGQG